MACAAYSIRGHLKLAAGHGPYALANNHLCGGLKPSVSYPISQSWSTLTSNAGRHAAGRSHLTVGSSDRWRSSLKASPEDGTIVAGKLLLDRLGVNSLGTAL
jgi:phosphoribosylamine--glycine ligase